MAKSLRENLISLSCFLTCLPGSASRCKLISPLLSPDNSVTFCSSWWARRAGTVGMAGTAGGHGGHNRQGRHGGHRTVLCGRWTQQSAPWSLLFSDAVPQTPASLASLASQPGLLLGRQPRSSVDSPACPGPVLGRFRVGLIWFVSLPSATTALCPQVSRNHHLRYFIQLSCCRWGHKSTSCYFVLAGR